MTQLLVNIDVDDLERGIAFYTQGLGLSVGRRFGQQAVELLGADSALYLLRKDAGSAPGLAVPGVRDFGRHWTPVHLDFVVEDIHAALRAAIAAGATQEGALRTQVWGYLAMFADPFGNGFCLLQFVGEGYDAIAATDFGDSPTET